MSYSRDNEDSLDPSAVTIFDLRSTLPIAAPTFDSRSSAYERVSFVLRYLKYIECVSSIIYAIDK